MFDLVWGLAVLVVAAMACFAAGDRLARRRPRWASLLAAGAVAFLVYFASALYGRLLLASLMPFSNVIVLGNALPPTAAFVAGVAHAEVKVPRWRRLFAIWLLLGGAWYAVFRDLTVVPAVTSAPRYSESTILQSSPATCSPSAAATLLLAHGIAANEAEMVALCLTRREGTPPLGLYRGLVRKTRGTPWRVAVVRRGDRRLADLEAPAILPVNLHEGDTHASLLRPAANPRVEHTVVFYGLDSDGLAEVGNPASGREHWCVERLEAAWTGEGLCLVPRNRAGSL